MLQQPCLTLGLLLVSLCQGIILFCGSLGGRLEVGQLAGIDISFSIVWQSVEKIGLSNAFLTILQITFFAFVIQTIPLVRYIHCNSQESQCKFALFVWLAPAIVLLPTIAGTIIYLLSPLLAIFILPSLFEGQLTKEDFADGFIFITAAIGWFNIFWFCVVFQHLLRICRVG